MPDDIPEWAADIRERLAALETTIAAMCNDRAARGPRSAIVPTGLGASIGAAMFAILEIVRHFA